MVRLRAKFGCWLAAAALLMVTGQASAQAPAPTSTPQTAPAKSAQAPVSRVHHKKKADPEPAAPAAPQPPPTLEQSAPSPPRVSYRNGELTIDAVNSTLAQVLRAVQSQTGASVDIPSGASGERVVAQLGPGQPRDVLNTLLNGSKFDYMILGSAVNPGAVQKVILTPRQSSGATSAQNATPAGQEPAAEDEPDEGAPVAETEPEQYPEQQQPPTPPNGFRRGPMGPGGQQFANQQNQNGDESQNGGKTPEQLMQELQQMQQQQQQYQQQLNPANQPPQQQQ